MSDVVLSWSGGKDSALALWTMREEGREPAALLTTINEDHERISIHGVRRELLLTQAAAVGLPLVEVPIPAECPNELYEERMAAALASPPLAEVETFAFADLFLADIRAYREERLAAIGRTATFPVWGRDTAALAERFVAAGFEATLVCVDPSRLDRSFAGRRFDADLLRDLPAGVDPCGENGEFHTFVSAGPILSAPVAFEHGETVERDGFVFHDLRSGGVGFAGSG
ncbi:MAG TPA: ATP-binding protein [Solirubrobacterales bacterium]|nr:ATP-binding protein [Solirubrobacterales bacterium]